LLFDERKQHPSLQWIFRKRKITIEHLDDDVAGRCDLKRTRRFCVQLELIERPFQGPEQLKIEVNDQRQVRLLGRRFYDLGEDGQVVSDDNALSFVQEHGFLADGGLLCALDDEANDGLVDHRLDLRGLIGAIDVEPRQLGSAIGRFLRGKPLDTAGQMLNRHDGVPGKVFCAGPSEDNPKMRLKENWASPLQERAGARSGGRLVEGLWKTQPQQQSKPNTSAGHSKSTPK